MTGRKVHHEYSRKKEHVHRFFLSPKVLLHWSGVGSRHWYFLKAPYVILGLKVPGLEQLFSNFAAYQNHLGKFDAQPASPDQLNQKLHGWTQTSKTI